MTNTTKLNKETQKAKRFLSEFYSHKNWTIFDVYKNPSSRKVRIFEYLKKNIQLKIIITFLLFLEEVVTFPQLVKMTVK